VSKEPKEKGKRGKKTETYNTRDSLVVTDPTTNLAVCSLAMGEQTGPRVLYILWSYVAVTCPVLIYVLVFICVLILPCKPTGDDEPMQPSTSYK
jgi:hypothetical protein